MSSENIQVGVSFNVDDSQIDAARRKLTTIVEEAAKQTGTVTQSFEEAASKLYGEDGVLPGQAATYSSMPWILRNAFQNMFNVATSQQQTVFSRDGAVGSKDSAVSTDNANAMFTATVHTMSESLLRLSGIFTAVGQALGTSTAGFTNFSKNVGSLHTRIAQFVDESKSILTAGTMSDTKLRQSLLTDKATRAGLDRTMAALVEATPAQHRKSLPSREALLDAIIPSAVSPSLRRNYWDTAARLGGKSIVPGRYENVVADYRQTLSYPFRHLPLDPRKMSAEERSAQHNYGNDVLTEEQWRIVRSLASENPTFEKALVNRGLAKRDVRGGIGLRMPETPIRKQELAEVLGIVAIANANALEGAPVWMKT
jgi:hypothetical protein